MSRDGRLPADTATRVTIPIGLRTLEEIKAPFAMTGEFGGLRLAHCELVRVVDPFWDEFERTVMRTPSPRGGRNYRSCLGWPVNRELHRACSRPSRSGRRAFLAVQGSHRGRAKAARPVHGGRAADQSGLTPAPEIRRAAPSHHPGLRDQALTNACVEAKVRAASLSASRRDWSVSVSPTSPSGSPNSRMRGSSVEKRSWM